jgi:hypothetical protein
MGFTAFALCRGIDIEFRLSVQLIRMIESLADTLPDALCEKNDT